MRMLKRITCKNCGILVENGHISFNRNEIPKDMIILRIITVAIPRVKRALSENFILLFL